MKALLHSLALALLSVACGGTVDQPATTAEGGATGAPTVELLKNEDGSTSLVSEEPCDGVLRLSWTVEGERPPDLKVWAEPAPTGISIEQTGPDEYLVSLEWLDAPPVVLVRGVDQGGSWASCAH